MPFIITTTGTNYAIVNKEQILDNVLVPAYKWFSLANNILDGSFHPIDVSGQYQVGWWGDTLSDINGQIANQTIEIKETRTIHKLRVVGDSLLNEYPVDFTISLYMNSTLLYTETVIGQNKVNWGKVLDKAYDVTSVVLNVTKINKPNTVLKIVDMFSPFRIPRSDDLLLSITEDSLVTESGRNEYATLKVIETNKLIISISSDDINYITDVSKTSSVSVSLHSNDNSNILIDENKKQLVMIGNKNDTLNISVVEKSKVKNIHTVMDSNLRQVFGKVEITYAAPFLGDAVDITSNQIGKDTSVEGIADNVVTSEYKWLSCHDNLLDGSYHPVPDSLSKKWHVGLWGTVLSDSNGQFSSNPVVTINFESRPIYYLKVSGDDKLQNYPVDFLLQVYNSANTIIYTNNVTDNTNAYWYEDLKPTLNDITKVVLTITRISKPNQVFKLTEFFNSIVETYYNNGIVNMHLLEELDYVESSVTLGAVSSNEMDIVLDNSSGKFNIMDPTIPLAHLIKRNRKVKAWLGAEIIDDIVEWYPLGTFYTTKWDIPDRSLTASLTARDILDVLNYSDFSASIVYVNKSITELYRIILNDAGLTEDIDYLLDNSLSNIIIPYAWFNKMTHRDALQRLSGCVMVQLYCDRNGIINITNMAPTQNVFYTFTDTRNVIKKDFPFVWNEITNCVEVSANIYAAGTKKNILETKESISVVGKSTVKLIYDFSSSPILNADAPVLIGNANLVVKNYNVLSSGIEIVIENNTLITQTLTSITVEGVALEKQVTSVCTAKDEAQIKENGTLKTTISHDFIQSTLYANTLASNLLSGYKESRYDVKLQCRGNIGLYLGEKVSVEDYKLGTSKPYVIKRQSIDWDGTLSASVECKNLE